MIILNLFSILIFTPIIFSRIVPDRAVYWKQREELINRDLSNLIGNDIVMTDVENEVNTFLMNSKMNELVKGFNTSNVLHAKHFYLAKQEIEASDVYKFIKKMPKGAILHSHDMALSPIDWIVSELTYWPNLYMCHLEEGRMLFKYFKYPDSTCEWLSVQDEREKINPQEFDLMLTRQFSLLTDNPERDLPSANKNWNKFIKVYESLGGMLNYDAAWKAFLVKAMECIVADNVQYFEFRGVLYPLYDLEGTTFTTSDIIKIYLDVITNFTANNADNFYGGRFIYSPIRLVTKETVEQYVQTAIQIKNEFPNFFLGFDLVQQEDQGRPLKDFIDPLLELQKSEVPLRTFFHAGETNWQGTDTDENLFDAILLNASRIGHGYALSKHPHLLDLIKERNIAVEICPVSNQVLHLVSDLRNHPMTALVADNFPLVVSSDDPGLWGADALSHDFYEAFFALGGAKADLRFLKKLALNSITYSGLNETEKVNLEEMWQKKWEIFLNEILTSYKPSK